MNSIEKGSFGHTVCIGRWSSERFSYSIINQINGSIDSNWVLTSKILILFLLSNYSGANAVFGDGKACVYTERTVLL